MSERSAGVRIAVATTVASAALGVWLQVRAPASQAAMFGGFAAPILLSLITPLALIPFARQRLARWTFVGLALWLIGAAIYIYLGTWMYLQLFEGAAWTPSSRWFIAHPAFLMAGQTLVLVALAAAMPSTPAPRSIRMLMITLASGVLAFVTVAIGAAFVDAIDGSLVLYRWAIEIAQDGSMLLFAYGLVHVDRTLRSADPPVARVHIGGSGGGT